MCLPSARDFQILSTYVILRRLSCASQAKNLDNLVVSGFKNTSTRNLRKTYVTYRFDDYPKERNWEALEFYTFQKKKKVLEGKERERDSFIPFIFYFWCYRKKEE